MLQSIFMRSYSNCSEKIF